MRLEIDLPPEGSQMTNQFIHEEISMFCSEKFSGGGGGWMGDIAIISSSFRSRSLRNLR